MPKQLLSFTILLSLLSPAANAGEGWYPSFDEALKASSDRQVPLLIHFHASWCGPCRQMESQVLSRPEVRSQLSKGLAAVEVDVSERPDLAQKYGATTVPRDVIVIAGESRTLNVGFKSVTGYMSLLRSVATKEPKLLHGASKATDVQETLLGLEGFCPVKLLKDREWVSGDQSLTETYRGVRYYLSSKQALELFKSNPRKYSPQNLGCDPVVLYSDQQAITGKIRYGAFFDNKLFLFDTLENRTQFKKSPLQYTRIQHAIKIDDLAGQRFN